MSTFQAIWLALFVIGGVVEFLALLIKSDNDTLSEQVWLLRPIRWVRAILMPFWMWLTWHFWFEPDDLGPRAGVWWDDGIVVAVFAVAAVSLNLYERPADTHGAAARPNTRRS